MISDTNVYADFPFLLAILALGFGLSLATYRGFARRYGWPMGEWHTNKPALPIMIGLITLAIGLFYALARGWGGYAFSGWAITGFGVLFAIIWTGILRVGSQISLFAAPAAAALLFVSWFGGPDALDYRTVRSEIRELRDQLRSQNVLPQPRRNNAQ